MSGLLNNGQWYTEKQWEKSNDGEFTRRRSSFRDAVVGDADAPYTAESGRYHLYISYACPWACRVLMVRALKGLEDVISVSAVHHFMGEDGWYFGPDDDADSDADPIINAGFLREIYVKANPTYTGRVTVPVFWDRQKETIVNNESSELIRMLDTAFHPLAKRDSVVLYPTHLRDAIDAATEAIYQPINNGVYRCGFAGTQAAYERAFSALFKALDHWEKVLGEQRYMCGEQLTLADVCMFTTLVRFDAVYYVHFKCNGKLIMQYPNLSDYLRELYQLPGVAATVNMHHIKQHYYRSHGQVNPKRFVPTGPDLSYLDVPHTRDRLPGGPPDLT